MKTKIKFDQKTIKAGEETSVTLLAKVTGPQGDPDREPLPLNLSVVIDRSTSMAGDKLPYVKAAARELVRALSAKDHLSIVSYGDDIHVELEAQPVENKHLFQRVIDRIQLRGSTNLHGGWKQGCDLVHTVSNQNGVNRVLLLTDGQANQGITDHHQIARFAEEERRDGVTTTTFGVGMGYNEDLLTRMADAGGGAFYFIDSPDQAEALFKEELKDLYNVVGQNLTVAIETESAVKSVKQIYDYAHSESRGALVYQLGDLFAEEDRTQIFELKLRALDEGEIKLGRVTISYDAIQGEKIKKVERVREIVIKAVPAEAYKKPRVDKEIRKLVLFQEVSEARKNALAMADRGDFQKAEQVLLKMADKIKKTRTKDEELLDLYDQLLEEARDMEFGAQRYDTYSRKSQMSKIGSATRMSRSHAMQDDLHYRKVMSAPSIERAGPAPGFIEWRGGQMRLEGPLIRIGTAPDNDIVLGEILVEAYHCRLEHRNGNWFLLDLSADGTIANSGRISGPFRLSVGDTIRLGKALLRLR